MKVYHYANKKNINDIFENGLTPINHQWIFSLESPIPEEWANNQLFPDVWEAFRILFGTELLEINIDDYIGKTFVRDFAHLINFQVWRNYDPNILEKYNHKTQKEAEKACSKTVIPLVDYLRNKKKLNYSLPEILIADVVKPKDIKFISK